MSYYTDLRTQFYHRLEAVESSFSTAVEKMDLDNVTLEDEMQAIVSEVAKAAAEARSSVENLG